MKFLRSLLIFMVTAGCSTTFATTGVADETASGYSLSKIEPEVTQVDQNSSFYDLLVSPGDEFVIQAQLTNRNQKETEIKSAAYTTFTNSHGEITYTAQQSKKKQDRSLKISFKDIAEVEGGEMVTLAGDESKVVSMKIKVPEDTPEGVILGSWYFEKEDQENPNKKKSEGIQIDNRFAYALAVKLTVQKEIEKPNLNLLKVKPALNNYRKVINANVQDDQPAIVSNLDFKGRITKKDSDDTLYNTQLTDRIMAPNSNFDVPFFLEEKQLEAGEYTLHLTATTKDKKWEEQSWTWKKDFKISREKAEQLNTKALNDPEPEKDYFKYILILIVILLLLIILFILIRNKRKAVEE